MRSTPYSLVAVILLAAPGIARAQIAPTKYQTLTSTSPTTDQLLTRIVALEARVAQLESLLSLVNGQLVLDGKTAPVLIRGGSVTIQPDGALTLRSGTSMTIGSSSSILLRGGSAVSVEGMSGLDLKGALITLNGGTKPVACAGSITTSVPGMTTHAHQLTPQGCGTSILVP